MNWKRIKKYIRLNYQYLPVTFNCLLLLLIVLWLWSVLNGQKEAPDNPSSFAPFILLMGKTALWFVFLLIGFSFLSALSCFLYFLWIRKKRKGAFVLKFEEQPEGNYKVRWNAVMGKVFRPFLGAVRCRLVYDDGLLTPKLILLGNDRENGKLFRKGITGKQVLSLPDIKEYNLAGCFIYFEDWLHLFSFSGFIAQTGYFHQLPISGKAEIATVQPTQVKEEVERVETAHATPGDYVNYKSFEGGDDIRRIVWKVYAKNRELMVRIPEIRDFYASHLTFYVSFHTGLPEIQIEQVFATEMLNFLKNRAWIAMEALLNKGISLKFIPDQPFEQDHTDPKEAIPLTLSNSKWQRDNDLSDYFPFGNTGIICISSFNGLPEITELLERVNKETIIYFVPLSSAFHHWVGWNWLKRIFVKADPDRLKRVRSLWPFSPLRFKVAKQEKSIMKLLETYDVQYGILQ